MNRLLSILLLLVGAPLASLASDLTVVNHPGWHDGGANLRATIAQKNLSTELVDMSIRSAGGFGVITQYQFDEEVSPKLAADALAGFLHKTSQDGHTAVSQEPAQLGPLQGFRVVTKGKLNGLDFGAVTFLLFTRRDLYSITAYGLAGTSDSVAVSDEYVSRIRFSPDIKPGWAFPNSAYEQGRRDGYIFGRYLLPLALLGVILVFYLRSRRSRSKDAVA